MVPNSHNNIFVVVAMTAEQPLHPSLWRWKKTRILLLGVLLLEISSIQATTLHNDTGINLVYDVSYQNIPLGRVHYQLLKTTPLWQVISRTEPNLLASLSSHSKRQETTLFQWSQTGLKPQQVDIADYRGPDTKIVVDWSQQKIHFPDQRTSAIPKGPLYTTMAMVYGIAFNPPVAIKPGTHLNILSEKNIEIYAVDNVTNTELLVPAGKFPSIRIRAKRQGVAGDWIELWLTTGTVQMVAQLDKYRKNKRTRFQLQKNLNWPPVQPLQPAKP